MNYYNSISSGYDELHEEEQLKKCKIIAEYFNSKNKKILDVGCGTGIAANFFHCKAGIDPAEKLIEIARKKYPKIKFLVAKSEKLPFKDNQFDAVISITAIQNFDDIEKGLREIERVGREFVLAFLKKSKKRDVIEKLIKKSFKIRKTMEEEKDIIYLAKRKNL